MAMPAANRETSRRWTAREVRELIAHSPLATPRDELVDGELLVTPSPSGLHQRAVGHLLKALLTYFESASCARSLAGSAIVYSAMKAMYGS